MIYRIGPLSFSIEGQGRLVDTISLEFDSFLDQDQKNEPLIRFVFDSSLPINTNGVISDPIISYGEAYKARHSGLIYFHERIEKKSRKITINTDISIYGYKVSLERLDIIKSFLRFINWNYLKPEEVLAKNFLYDVFDYISQIELLSQNASYIHSSAFVKEDQCMVITGRGGIGKSSLLLKSVLEKEWKYISDDLAVVGENGKIWRTPKKLQIYGYNLEGEKNISDALLKDRNIFDLLAWYARFYLKGGKRVRRRVSASEIFGDEYVMNFSFISKIFFLEKAECNKFSISNMSIEEFSNRSAYVLVSEINPFLNISLALYSSGNSRMIPKVSEMISLTESVYLKSLKGIDCYLVAVPINATPSDLSIFFSSIF